MAILVPRWGRKGSEGGINQALLGPGELSAKPFFNRSNAACAVLQTPLLLTD